jgi:FkbM family methyltransferase
VNVRELQHLLGSPPVATGVPAQATYVLYGAGTFGRHVLAGLRSAGVEPVAFADDTPEKQGSVIDGLQVLALGAAARQHADAVFAVTIFNAEFTFTEARSRLRAFDVETLSFIELGLRFAPALLPLYCFADPEVLKRAEPELTRLWHTLEDDASREHLLAHLRLRLQADHDALPAPDPDSYFATDIVGALPSDIVYVDGGAYDGDTLRRFLAKQDSEFAAAIVVEPDPENAERLGSYVGTLPSAIRERIEVRQAAIAGTRGVAEFASTGDMSATLRRGGSTLVDTILLHDLIDRDETAFVKLDIEGAEYDALAAGEAVLKRRRPLIAAAVYHLPADLWRIPLLLHDLSVGYRLFLRTHGPDGGDLICYAMPG